MHDSSLVRVLQARAHLEGNVDDLLRPQRVAFVHDGREIASPHELHHEIARSIRSLIGVEDPDDMARLEARDDARLLLEATNDAFTVACELLENLDRDVVSQREVCRFVHDAHRSRTELAQKLVLAEAGAGFRCHPVRIPKG